MSDSDGGRTAARGFQYQYLRTVEALLSNLGSSKVFACRIEGAARNLTEVRTDIVDFDLIDQDGNCLVAVQVKSAKLERQITAPAAVSILLKLINSSDAQRYELITSAVPDKQCRILAWILENYDSNSNEFESALGALLARAPKAKKAIRSLSSVEIARLAKARILFDQRDESEIRKELKVALRDHRSRHGKSMGQESAGLVLGNLVAEILRRAADPTSAEWKIQDFAKTVGANSATLITALGRKDWGIIYGAIPPLPDVRRAVLMDQLTASFSAIDKAENQITTCALTGLSGIGKSSTAAEYIAENGDEYDLILWVDSSTTDSLTAAFRKISDHLTSVDLTEEQGRPAEFYRESVHEALRSMPGRWLLVLDDASSRTVSPWLPKFGHGDVIITSTDSSAWHRLDARVEVTQMTNNESIQLFANRTRVTGFDVNKHHSAVDGLLDRLDRWPLAIELACGYLVSCNFDLDDLSRYRNVLIERAMDDSFAVPEGYPRTLVAAVRMSVSRLEEMYSHRANFLAQVREFLGYLCYFSPQRAPVNLIASSAFAAPQEPEPASILTLMDESEIPIREILRALIQVSFVRFSEPITQLAPELPNVANETVSLNSVLQEILRSDYDGNSNLYEALPKCAFHIDRWLSNAIELGNGSRAWELVQHALAVIGHVERLNIRDNRTALLLGNVAAFYETQRESAVARSMLETELSWLEEIDDRNELLVAQSKIALAGLYAVEEFVEDVDNVAKLISEAKNYLEVVSQEHQPAAAFLVMRTKLVVESQLRINPGHSTLTAIDARLSELIDTLPVTPITGMMRSVADVNRLMAEGTEIETEQAARNFLSTYRDASGASMASVLEVRRLLIEALVRQGKWADASAEFDNVASFVAPFSMYKFSFQQVVHNVGLTCALHWLAEGSAPAGNLLNKILKESGMEFLIPALPDAIRARFALLEAVAASARGDYNAGKGKLEELGTRLFSASFDEEAQSWEKILRMLPGRIAIEANKTIHEKALARSRKLVEKGREGIYKNKTMAQIIEDAECWTYACLSSEGAFNILHFSGFGDILGSELGESPERSNFPIVIFQPKKRIILRSSTDEVEFQLHDICESGFRRFNPNFPTIPSLSWELFMNETHLVMQDENGKKRSTGRGLPGNKWLATARRLGSVLVFYGWGFDLDKPTEERGYCASEEVFQTQLLEAARKGQVAIGRLRWKN